MNPKPTLENLYFFRHFIKEMSSLIIKNDIRNPVLYNFKLIQEVEECEVRFGHVDQKENISLT